MITKCPYPECAAEFEVDFELPEGDWHFPSGACPRCGLPSTFKPLSVIQSIEKNYKKRCAAQQSTGGTLPNRRPAVPIYALVDDVRSMWNVGAFFRTCDG